MTDVLIRNVDESTLRRIDLAAERLGLSRTEYLRRAVTRLGRGTERSTTVDDLHVFGDRFADLTDADVMNEAWS